jgi:hypothetical protein
MITKFKLKYVNTHYNNQYKITDIDRLNNILISKLNSIWSTFMVRTTKI